MFEKQIWKGSQKNQSDFLKILLEEDDDFYNKLKKTY